MAETTLAAVIAHVRAVLEDPDLAFVPTRDQFTHDRQPNTVLDHAYWLEDGGISSSRPLTNYAVARLDRITVYVAKKMNFSPVNSYDALQDTLVAIERAVKADGPDHSYYAEVVARRITKAAALDVAIGSLTFALDFDMVESVA